VGAGDGGTENFGTVIDIASKDRNQHGHRLVPRLKATSVPPTSATRQTNFDELYEVVDDGNDPCDRGSVQGVFQKGGGEREKRGEVQLRMASLSRAWAA